jgi:hypothetical protein
VGNTVVASCITARARLGVWMMAKALGLRQSITDGGFYLPALVCFCKGRRPGLDTLSRGWEWRDTKNQTRWHGPLAGLSWDGDWPKDVDRLALEHVQGFWAPYGLEFPFRIEHKGSFEAAAYWSKGDYWFDLGQDRPPKCALRGKDKKAKDHPTFRLLENIIRGVDEFPAALANTQRGIMRLGKYQVVQACQGYEHLKALRPGDDYSEPRTARYNNTYFPLADEDDYRRRRDRRKTHRGQVVEWFERFRALGIEMVHRKMGLDRLR